MSIHWIVSRQIQVEMFAKLPKKVHLNGLIRIKKKNFVHKSLFLILSAYFGSQWLLGYYCSTSHSLEQSIHFLFA